MTRDLGLTFTSSSKSKADAPKESKKTEKTKDRGFLEDASLSDVAKEMLRDLQPGKIRVVNICGSCLDTDHPVHWVHSRTTYGI